MILSSPVDDVTQATPVTTTFDPDEAHRTSAPPDEGTTTPDPDQEPPTSH